jgi:hypothetical protein
MRRVSILGMHQKVRSKVTRPRQKRSSQRDKKWATRTVIYEGGVRRARLYAREKVRLKRKVSTVTENGT